MVVDKDSAIMGYPNEITKSMNADHHTVCKFDNKDHPDYISIRNALKTLITDVCSTGTFIVARRLVHVRRVSKPTFSLHLLDDNYAYQ